jgi:hypothetical protein
MPRCRETSLTISTSSLRGQSSSSKRYTLLYATGTPPPSTDILPFTCPLSCPPSPLVTDVIVDCRWPTDVREWDGVSKTKVKPHTVTELTRGSYFGELSIIKNKNRTASAKAKTRSLSPLFISSLN